MKWRGKAIGGSIGSFFGPWGTVAGMAAGHLLVDKKEGRAMGRARMRLLALAAGAMRELAICDGRFTAQEDALIRSLLEEINEHTRAGLSRHDLAYLLDDSPRLNHCVERLADLARGNAGLAFAAASWLWRVAVCDGDPKPREVECIGFFANRAGLSPSEAESASLIFIRLPRTPAAQSIHEACSALGVEFNADRATCKQAYRKLSQLYHPDKHGDLAPEIRALTADKFARINEAYRLLTNQEATECDALVVKCALSGRPRQVEIARHTPITCFICGARTHLTERDNPLSARCLQCQALLAFEPELAEQLL